jgi:hypothetical protein
MAAGNNNCLYVVSYDIERIITEYHHAVYVECYTSEECRQTEREIQSEYEEYYHRDIIFLKEKNAKKKARQLFADTIIEEEQLETFQDLRGEDREIDLQERLDPNLFEANLFLSDSYEHQWELYDVDGVVDLGVRVLVRVIRMRLQ